jgi:predicted molibdopterin-dependent oxidoreductase YjgC
MRKAARTEAFDRILRNHELYCTVCDKNNGNCTVHNTTKLLAVEHQRYPFQEKPYQVDNSNPFYRYDPNQIRLDRASRTRWSSSTTKTMGSSEFIASRLI